MNDPLPRVGLLLPTREVEMGTGLRLGDVVELAVAAEEAGLAGVWVGDSPLARPRAEPFTLLGAVATRTTRVGLGTAALLPALRPPLHTAHAAATLDQLAPGRITLGVGAGFPLEATRAEFSAFGAPFSGRSRRLDRIVDLWRAQWSGDTDRAAATAQTLGIETTATTLAALPRPTTPGGPAVWLAAGASPTITTRLAEHYDGWLPYIPTPTTYATSILAASPRPPVAATLAASPPRATPSPTGAPHPSGAAAEPGQTAIASSTSSSVPSARPSPSTLVSPVDLARHHRAPALGLYVTLTLAEDDSAVSVARARATHEAYLQAYYGVGAGVIASVQACHVGDPASAADFLGRYVSAGARHFVVRLAAPASQHAHQLRLLVDEVVPALRGLTPNGHGR